MGFSTIKISQPSADLRMELVATSDMSKSDLLGDVLFVAPMAAGLTNVVWELADNGKLFLNYGSGDFMEFEPAVSSCPSADRNCPSADCVLNPGGYCIRCGAGRDHS